MQNKQKILFIDRDGTLILEPPIDFQVDSLEKLEFYPGVFQHMARIAAQLSYKLVMVTNQDGLGTHLFPEDTFWPAHRKMIHALEGEGIRFDAVHIDRTLPKENAPTRKPRTGMLTGYSGEQYDLPNSYVIGDRLTDVELAKNLGCKAILLKPVEEGEKLLASVDFADACALVTPHWSEVAAFLFRSDRTAVVERRTAETQIRVEVDLDGTGQCHIHTGLGFFDHMLEQIGRHSNCNLNIEVKGDLHVDEHHTIEDTALALGEAFRKALGDKRGIERYGYCLPMDDCLATVAIDFGGRPWLVWEADFKREKVGDMPTEMFPAFF
ncbi:MAG: bifunctional histidinol-phosphatase/imidazoleglycerol-phosphate dehydratase HisB [Breznakibacter sp.]